MVLQVPIDDIYKVRDKESKNIYIFGGEYTSEIDLRRIYGSSILEKLQKENFNFVFSEYLIYKTDSISAIKNKLLVTIQRSRGSVDDLKLNNIYLFSSKFKKVDVEKVYRARQDE